MSEKLRIIVKEPKKKYEFKEFDSETSSDNIWNEIRNIVNGYVELIPIKKDKMNLCIFCDEDALYKDYSVNFLIKTNNPIFPIQEVKGTIVIAKFEEVDGEMIFHDLSDKDIVICENVFCMVNIY